MIKMNNNNPVENNEWGRINIENMSWNTET